MRPKIDILVISCDSYYDVWPYFFDGLFKNWIDCPLDIYLVSNKKRYGFNNVINLNIGKDISWSNNLKKALKKIKNEFVLLMIDDLIIKNKISNNFFMEISDWISMNDPNYLRLHVSNRPLYYDSLVGELPKKTPYKLSTMPSIWKTSFLLKILKDGESAWDFELKGSKRAYKYDKFFSLYENFISYNNSIIKGKWQRGIVDKYAIKNSFRPSLEIHEQLIYDIRVLRSKLFNFLPNFVRLKVKKQ